MKLTFYPIELPGLYKKTTKSQVSKFYYKFIFALTCGVCDKNVMGEYPDLNRKLTVPHTVVLPIELYSPFLYILNRHNFIFVFFIIN